MQDYIAKNVCNMCILSDYGSCTHLLLKNWKLQGKKKFNNQQLSHLEIIFNSHILILNIIVIKTLYFSKLKKANHFKK